MEKLDPTADGRSLDNVADSLDKMRQLFPDAFTEGRVDFDALRDILGDYVEDRQERYSFAWHGKSAARRIAQTPSSGTLRPSPADSLDWDETQNIFIEGDNLEVLKLLQKSYYGRVKMIYIDPPYNTGKEFIYPDKYQDNLNTYLRYTGQVSEEGLKLSANSETSGRYHTNWLNMMYPRLKLARNLLRDDGAIFVSIGPEEVKNTIALLGEIFGEENAVSVLTWEQGRKNDSTFYSESVDYVVIFAKNRSLLAAKGPWRERKEGVDSVLEHYADLVVQHKGDHSAIEAAMRTFYRSLDASDPRKKHAHFYRSDDRGLYFGADISSASTSIPDYDILHPVTGKPVKKPARGWGATEPVMLERIREGRVLFGDDENTIPLKKSYLAEVDSTVKTPVLYKDGRAATKVVKDLMGANVFNNPKDHTVLADFISYCLQGEQDALVLDFFAGSCSTAHAVMSLNGADGGARRYIMVQLPEPCAEGTEASKAGYRTIADIGRERLRRSAKQIRSESEHGSSIDLGFRAFRLDSSNLSTWDPQADDLDASLFEAVDNVKTDRNSEDLLYELLLKSGIDLSTAVEESHSGSVDLHVVGEGALVVCLQESVSDESAQAIVELRETLDPSLMRVVFRDSAFPDDVVKTNVVQALHLAGVDDVKSI